MNIQQSSQDCCLESDDPDTVTESHTVTGTQTQTESVTTVTVPAAAPAPGSETRPSDSHSQTGPGSSTCMNLCCCFSGDTIVTTMTTTCAEDEASSDSSRRRSHIISTTESQRRVWYQRPASLDLGRSDTTKKQLHTDNDCKSAVTVTQPPRPRPRSRHTAAAVDGSDECKPCACCTVPAHFHHSVRSMTVSFAQSLTSLASAARISTQTALVKYTFWGLSFAMSAILVCSFVLLAAMSGLQKSRLAASGLFLQDAALTRLKAIGNQSQMELFPQRHNSNKLVLMHIDGFRFAALQDYESLRALFSATGPGTFAADSKLYTMVSELPTITTPNFVSLMTGVSSEIHGDMGNEVRAGDSMFSIGPGPDFMFTELPTVFDVMGQYGMNASYYVPSPQYGEALRRGMPGRVLNDMHNITTKVAYPNEFLVARKHHFSADIHNVSVINPLVVAKATLTGADVCVHVDYEIDKACHGWSTPRHIYRPEYVSAIDLFSQRLQAIVDLIDQDTVLVLYADHGCLTAGGHGSAERHARNVPLILYKKNSGLGNVTLEMRGIPNIVHELQPGHLERYVHMFDMAAVLTAVVGLPVPPLSYGIYPPDALLFAGVQSAADAYPYYTHQRVVMQAVVREIVMEIGQDVPPLWLSAPVSPANAAAEAAMIRRTWNYLEHARDEAIRRYRSSWRIGAIFIGIAFVILSYIFMIKTQLRHIGHSWRLSRIALVCVLIYALVVLAGFFSIFAPHGFWPADEEFLWNSSQLDIGFGSKNLNMFGIILCVMGVPVVALVYKVGKWWASRSVVVALVRPKLLDKWKLCPQKPVELCILIWKAALLQHSTAAMVVIMIIGSMGRIFLIEGLHNLRWNGRYIWCWQFIATHLTFMFLPLILFSLVVNFPPLKIWQAAEKHISSMKVIRAAEDAAAASQPHMKVQVKAVAAAAAAVDHSDSKQQQHDDEDRKHRGRVDRCQASAGDAFHGDEFDSAAMPSLPAKKYGVEVEIITCTD
jgi:Type I phosphodiesterase / nucleotide pyrophosphatase